MIVVDGSWGEGGGQMVRSSLTLALLTGEPVRIVNIRAGRKRPGLLRQHLTALRAAAEVGRAQVTGDQVGSNEITFSPEGIAGGDYHFSIGSAGSTGLVLQTILPALFRADEPSEVRVEGGTHNAWSPPFDFLNLSWATLMRKMGAEIDIHLEKHGFYPAGGGAVVARVRPRPLRPLELVDRGVLHSAHTTALVAKLPTKIGQRQVRVVTDKVSVIAEGEVLQVQSDGPGNVVYATCRFKHITAVFTAFGAKGIRAEEVASSLCREVQEYLDRDVPVDEHLADQLMIPLWMAGGSYRTSELSQHSRTNLGIIAQFVKNPLRSEATSRGVLISHH